jgi:hypothetical protein
MKTDGFSFTCPDACVPPDVQRRRAPLGRSIVSPALVLVPSADDHEVALPGHSNSAADSRDTIPPQRIAEIRRRIRSGAYDNPAIIDAVARGIMRRGDL